jgi:hypothetical protein
MRFKCCGVCINFECALEGGCHSGVGWVTMTDANGAVIYDECPSGNVARAGGDCESSEIAFPITLTVQYNHTSGPCPGGHCCDRAVFKVMVTGCTSGRDDCDLEIGEANLNNESCNCRGSGCNRGPFTFTITKAQIQSVIQCLRTQSTRSPMSIPNNPNANNFFGEDDPDNLAP